MRTLLLSSVEGNSGPDAVNRKIVEHWPETEDIITIRQCSRLGKITRSFLAARSADVVVSAAGDWLEILACSAFHRIGIPVVCFNHGYLPFENEANNLGLSGSKVAAYKKYLKEADLVVANSKHQMHFLQQMQPELTVKTAYVNNAVEPFPQQKREGKKSEKAIIAVSGGTRPIKGNEVVARAIRRMADHGITCELQVFGYSYADNPALMKALDSIDGQLFGQVSAWQFLERLGNADIFVMNSRHESFGLSALDAISAGTSVLLSKNCGVADLLSLDETDVVQDCENEEEIASKLIHLLEYPNAKRVYESIDFHALNWESSVREFFWLCKHVVDARQARNSQRGIRKSFKRQ